MKILLCKEATARLTIFCCQNRTHSGKYMKNALYVLWPKGTSQTEAMPNSNKVKPITLAIIELCLFEGISRLLC